MEQKGISSRQALVGAIIIIVVTSVLTWTIFMFNYRALINDLSSKAENIALMEEMSKSPSFERLVKVLSIVKNKYIDNPDIDKLLLGAAEGSVSALNDPYSTFFTVKEFKSFHEETDGTYGGIGVQVTDEGKYVVVVAAFPNTPGAVTRFEGAKEGDPAGLKPRDKIIKVDGRDIVGQETTQVVKLIKGQPGTMVELTVLREHPQTGTRELVFKIERARIVIPTTEAKLLSQNPNIGYLKINQFLEMTTRQVRQDIDGLKEKGAQALILDLRHNPGGRLDVVVEIAGMFVPRGPVVHVVDRSGKRVTHTSNNPGGLGMPLVVLVDEASASASEILAGAIQDREAGVLVGVPTFGKGLVQQVWDLEDGTGLKLTVSKYLTPKGRDINRKIDPDTKKQVGGGIKPDIEVPWTEDARFGDPKTDPQLGKALEVVTGRLAIKQRASGTGG